VTLTLRDNRVSVVYTYSRDLTALAITAIDLVDSALLPQLIMISAMSTSGETVRLRLFGDLTPSPSLEVLAFDILCHWVNFVRGLEQLSLQPRRPNPTPQDRARAEAEL
jgi:hypothetical protein